MKKRTCRRCTEQKHNNEFGMNYCYECELELGVNRFKKYSPSLCIDCQARPKMQRSEYCEPCYESNFKIRVNEGLKIDGFN